MSSCQDYKVGIPKDSPSFALYQAQKKAGKTDSQIDRGFRQIDYSRPGEWGYIEGAGDCFIDERESTRTALEDWEIFRKPLTKWFEKPLPLDLQAVRRANPANQVEWTEVDEIRMEGAIEAIKTDLRTLHPNARPGSEPWGNTLAEALFVWWQFPRGEDWRLFGDEQKREILDSFHQIDPLNLPHFQNYLLQAGGLGGMYYFPMIHPESPSGYSVPFIFPEVPFQLHHIFKKAGLNPGFVEFSGIKTAGPFQCNRSLMTRIGVGLKNPGGWRLFDPIFNRRSVEDEAFYPLSLRQAVQHQKLGAQLLKYLSSPVEKHIPPMSLSADGFFSAAAPVVVLSPYIRPDRDLEEVLQDKGPPPVDPRWLIHPKMSHPVVYGLLLLTGRKRMNELNLFDGPAPELPPHPVYPERGLIDRLTFEARWFQAEIDSADKVPVEETEALTRQARSLLEIDPQCQPAHHFLALWSGRGKISLPVEETESHFTQASQAFWPKDNSLLTLSVGWGIFKLRDNKREEAQQKFLHAYNHSSVDPDDKARASLYLALIHSQQGDLVTANQYLTESRGSLLKAIQQARIQEPGSRVATSCAEWLVQRHKNDPFPAQALEDPHIANSLTDLHQELGKFLLGRGKSEEAGTLFRIALDVAPKRRRPDLLMNLHQGLVQQGKIEEAREVWDRLIRELGGKE